MQSKTPSFEVEEAGYRQRPPSILWFGGSCSSVVVSHVYVYVIIFN